MSLNAAAIAVMVERGLSAADILAVAEALEVRKDRTGAERQARLRERRAAEREAVTRDSVTRDVTRDVSPSLSPSPSFPPNPQTNPAPMPIPVCVAGARGKFLEPEGVSSGQWRAFCQQRKKPLNERSYLLLTNKLRALAEAGYPPGEMIDLATERGWETVFKPRDQRNDQPQPASRNTEGFRLAMRGHDPQAAF